MLTEGNFLSSASSSTIPTQPNEPHPIPICPSNRLQPQQCASPFSLSSPSPSRLLPTPPSTFPRQTPRTASTPSPTTSTSSPRRRGGTRRWTPRRLASFRGPFSRPVSSFPSLYVVPVSISPFCPIVPLKKKREQKRLIPSSPRPSPHPRRRSAHPPRRPRPRHPELHLRQRNHHPRSDRRRRDPLRHKLPIRYPARSPPHPLAPLNLLQPHASPLQRLSLRRERGIRGWTGA